MAGKKTQAKRKQLDIKEQKKRLLRFVRSLFMVLLIGIIYYLIVTFTRFSVSCPIRHATGKLCPGCGISRMCIALLHLDMKKAFLANRFLFCLLPVLFCYGVWKEYLYIRYDDTTMSKAELVGVIILFVMTVAYWIMRNMEAFSYLQPMG